MIENGQSGRDRAGRRSVLALLAIVVGALAPASTARAADAAIGIDWSVEAPSATTPAWMTRIASTSTGVFVLGDVDGELDGADSLGGRDIWVARYDLAGALVWARQFGTPGVDGSTEILATATALYISFHGGGHEEDGVTIDQHNVVLKLDHAGAESWRRALPSAQNGRAYIAVAYDGGVAVTAANPTTLTFPFEGTALVRQYSSNGTPVWQDTVVGTPLDSGSSGAWTQAIAADPGGVTVAGVRAVNAAPVGNAFVRRYSINGDLLWERTIEDPYNGTNPQVAAASSGAIWVGGTSSVPITGAPNQSPDANYFVRRFGFDGSTAWTRDIRANVLLADCSSFVAIGRIPIDGDNWAGAFVERLSAAGTSRWRWEQAGTTTTNTDFLDVAASGPKVYLVRDVWSSSGPYVQELVALEGVPAPSDCDTVAPIATPPARTIVTGSAITSGKVPVRLTWGGSDATSGIARYELGQSTDGGTWTTVSTSLTRSTLDRALAAQHTYRFRVRAIDSAGNASGWVAGASFKLSRYQEKSSRIAYRGTWRRSLSSVFWGGAARRATATGATATITFTGRSIGWVARLGPTRGKAEIYVNGVKVAKVNLYASTYKNQRIVWSRNWSSSASRRVTIRVLGTQDRPRVDLDAFVAGS